MNEESILKLNKWFAEKYHIEWALMDRINNDLSNFIQSMPDDVLQEFVDNPEFLKVKTLQNTDSIKVDVWLNPFFLMTLGITSRSILDLEEDLMHKYAVEKIKSKYADIRIREKRRCRTCDTSNRIGSNYCSNAEVRCRIKES